MANPSIVLLALMVVATASVSHDIIIIDGQSVASSSSPAAWPVCLVTGNPSGTGIAGINVFVSCNGGQSYITQAITDATGLVTLIITTADGTLFDQSLCFAIVQLPVATCTVLPPTGNLRALITLVSITSAAVGQVANLVFGTFIAS